MREYGVVIGQADPSFFDFNIIDPVNRPVSYEYIEVEVEEPQPDGVLRRISVLGQVKNITSRHPFYDERTTPGAAWKQRELGVGDELIQVIASAKILGYLHEERGRSDVRRPRSPPMPGTPVYRASDELLQKLFSLGEDEIPLWVGSLLHRESIEVPISGKELHRHTAILAMTRYGKSYFAGRIIEQLLRQGASIIVIDVHGDYANMVLDPSGAEHEFFRDKVTVYRPDAAEVFKAPHVKPFKIGVYQCTFNELCRLARIEGSLQRIVLRRILKTLRQAKPGYSLDDVLKALDEAKNNAASKDEIKRISRVEDRLEDLADQKIFSDGDIPVSEFFRPLHMSDIFLSGISDHIQDVLVGVILRKVFDSKYRHEQKAANCAPIC